jgi:hypothetical protein
LFPPRHRPKGEIARAAGKRFPNLAHEQQVCGTGNEETSGSAIAIDGAFHGPKKPRFALHLVKRYRFGAPNKGIGITAGRVEHVEIVERSIATISTNQILGKRALSGLSRSGPAAPSAAMGELARA